MNTERRFGWRQSNPDYRDIYRYKAPAGPFAKKLDLRNWIALPVYDQGAEGTCVANAGCSCHLYVQIKQAAKQIINPSRKYVYYGSRVFEGLTAYDSGATIRDGAKALARWGACDESEWPYSKLVNIQPTPGCYESGEKHQITNYFRIPQDERSIKACLRDGFPLMFGATLYESFYDIGKDGMMKMPAAKEDRLGGHAITIVGWDDAISSFIIQNSWGEYWADHGFFCMPYKYALDRDFCADFWTLRMVES